MQFQPAFEIRPIEGAEKNREKRRAKQVVYVFLLVDPGGTLFPSMNQVLFHRVRRGFTLIEILVSVGILVVLAALLLPSIKSSIESSRKAKCVANLRQMGAAFLMYANENDQYGPDAPGNGGLSYFRVGQSAFEFGQLLPYLGVEDYTKYMLPDSRVPDIFTCPSSPPELLALFRSPIGVETTSYWMSPVVAKTPANSTKLISLPQRTIAMMDICTWWLDAPVAWAPEGHQGKGFNAFRLDGSVEWISKKRTLGVAGAWDWPALDAL
jgi:prepilin-type N-terminal cleavage/methylation domain-containing protein